MASSAAQNLGGRLRLCWEAEFRTMLWTLVGDYWRHPVVSEPSSGTDILKVNLAPIPILAKQKAAVEAFLTEHSINHNEQGWFILKHHLADCALNSEGMDPEDCVSWTPEVLEMPSTEGSLRGMDKFFERLSGAGWGTVAALKTFYFRFSVAMLEQLVFHKQPIDLVWCKIHSIPYRKNWMQVLMQLDMVDCDKWDEYIFKRRKFYRRRFPTNDKKAMVKRGLPDLLLDTHLLGIESRQTRLSRSIEVELTPLFWENLRYAESLPSYPGKLRCRAEEIMEKQNTILALYAAFIQESRNPFVVIRGNRLPQSGKGRWCGNQDQARRVLAISNLPVAYGATKDTESVEGSVVDEDAARLSEVSDLQSQGSDLWNEGSDVDPVCVCASSG